MNIDDIRKDVVIKNYDNIFKMAGDSIGLRKLTYKHYLGLDKRNKDEEEKQRKIEEFIENHLQNPKSASNKDSFNKALYLINQNLEKEDRPFDIYSFLDLGKKLFSEEKEEEKNETNDDLDELEETKEEEEEIEIPVEEIGVSVEEFNLKTPKEELGTPSDYDVENIKLGLDGLFQKFSMGKTAKKDKKEANKEKKGIFKGLGGKIGKALKNPLVTLGLTAGLAYGAYAIPTMIAASTTSTFLLALGPISLIGLGAGAGYYGYKTIKLAIQKLKEDKGVVVSTSDKEMTEALNEFEKEVQKEEEKKEIKEVTKTEETEEIKTEENENQTSFREVTAEEPLENYNTIKVTPKHLLEKQDYLLHLYESLSLDEEDIKHVRDADLDLMRRNFEALYRSRVEKVKENKEQLSPEKLEIEKTKVGIMSSFLNLNPNALRSNWKNFREYFKKEVDDELENNKKIYASEMFNHADESYQTSMVVVESTQNKMANTFGSVENKDMLLRLNSLYAKKVNDIKDEQNNKLTNLTNEMVHYYDEISKYRTGGYENAAEAIEGKKEAAKLEDRKNVIRQKLNYINRIQDFQQNRKKKVIEDFDDEMPEDLSYEDIEEVKRR